jgi:hypothetical protein
MAVYNRAEDISLALKARIEQILIANGFETDVGTTVHRGRIAFEDSDAPCTTMLEGRERITDHAGRFSLAQISQSYAFVGYVNCDPDNPNVAAHKVIRDFKRAIFANNNGTLDNKVKSIKYRGRTIAPRADGSALVQALIEIEVEYAEDLTNP